MAKIPDVADRRVEHIRHHRERRADIDQTDDKVLQQTSASRLFLDDQEDAHEADEGPGEIDPPHDLDAGDHAALKQRTVLVAHFVRDDVVGHQQGGEGDEEDDLRNQPPVGMVAQRYARDQSADEDEQRDLSDGFGYQGPQAKVGWHRSILQGGDAMVRR